MTAADGAREPAISVTARPRNPIAWFRQTAGIEERIFYLLCFAALVAVRLPNILLQGRFWAEEGTRFFTRALLWPFWQALFAPYAGYLNLVANLGGIVASHIPNLALAPYGSSAVGFLFQCLPAALLIFSAQDWLRSRAATIIALLLLATPIAADEVWISSISSQSHLTLAVGIILALQVPRFSINVIYCFVLLLTALSAPGSWLLAPLFLLRAAIERCIPRLFQGLIFFGGLALQLTLFYTSIPGREIRVVPNLIGAIALTKHVLVPFLGPVDAAASAGALATQFRDHIDPLWPLAVVASLFAILLLCAVTDSKKSPLWFLIAGALCATAAYSGALGSKLDLVNVLGGARYAFAPQLMFELGLLSWSAVNVGWTRYVSMTLVVWLLAVGMRYYPVPLSTIFADGPSWQAQVETWRRNPDYVLKIWPPGWMFRIPVKKP